VTSHKQEQQEELGQSTIHIGSGGPKVGYRSHTDYRGCWTVLLGRVQTATPCGTLPMPARREECVAAAKQQVGQR
jgi:hypothetical protein